MHGNLNIFKNGELDLISNIIERLSNGIRMLMGLSMAGRERKKSN